MKTVFAIIGPTAVGKTKVCINLAEWLKTEIISCDSRQFYHELKIGTAVPTQNELNRVPHHFIGHLSVKDSYSVFKYERDALEKMEGLFQKNENIILTGGSGLYLDAIIQGMDDIPDPDPKVREELIKRLENEGLEALRKELRLVDLRYYQSIDLKNPKRVLRGLEVFHTTGQPFTSFRRRKTSQRPFKIRIIQLNRPREELYQRIDQRVDNMIMEGLVEEVQSLTEYQNLNALNTVGYKEIFAYFRKTYPLDEAIRLIKRNSRHYAKRQLTWNRKYTDADQLHPDAIEALKVVVMKDR